MPNARTIFKSRWSFSALLVAIVLALYAASINFGLIWDDPSWYQQGAGQSLGQIFTSLNTYQFYRPLAIGLNRLLVAPSGIVNAPLAHLIQIAAHLVTTLAVVPVLRAFKFDERTARISALLFAIYPLSYQAVAWQAPQQPIATLAVFVVLLAADRFMRRDQIRYLIVSLTAYAFGLLFQESTLPFVLGFFWLAYLNRSTRTSTLQRWWPLLHLALATAYFFIWLNVPRQAGVTGRGLQLNVLAYGLQAIVFPFANLFSSMLSGMPVATLAIGFAAITVLLLVGVWQGQGWRAAAFGGMWIAAGLVPMLVGLSWNYVRTGSRLLYPASLGIAIMWGSCIASLWTRRPWQRVISLGLAVIVIVVSIGQWSQFQRVYMSGTQYLDSTIQTLAKSSGQSLLFVNYPDRIELRPAPYPLGNWGLILAPVAQNLSDYARSTTGSSAATQSLSAFQTGADDRGAWSYTVFMRGEDTPAQKLYDVAATTDRVLITDYLPDGQLHLRDVGAIQSGRPSSSNIATFGDTAQLISATIALNTELEITLVWRSLKPLRDGDTIFVHHWRDGNFVNAYDGDSLGGLIPLSAWQTDSEVIDVRHLPLANFDPARDELRVGIYNRYDGGRYVATDANDQRLPDDAVALVPAKPH